MKIEKSIKEGGINERRGSENCKRKHSNSLNHIYNHFQSIYTRTDLLELCREQIYLEYVWYTE